MSNRWKFLDKDIPTTKRRGKSSEYRKIVEEALNNDTFKEKGRVKVEYEGVKMDSLYSALLSALNQLSTDDPTIKEKIKVVKRKDFGVWLINPEKEE